MLPNFASAQAIIESKEFISALGGAVVGGAIAAGLQWQNLREARAERERIDDQRKRGLGFSILYKALKIHSNNVALRRHLLSQVGATNEFWPAEPNWRMVKPFGNLPDKVHFSPDEIALLFSLKDDDTTNAMMVLDDIHNSQIVIFEFFDRERMSLMLKYPVVEMDGLNATIQLNQDEMGFYHPRDAALKDMVRNLMHRADLDARDSQRITRMLQKTLSLRLGLNVPYREKFAIPQYGESR